MIQATFLDHSGFLVELPSVTLLFDWWKGPLPALRQDKPLLVFSSHWHEDHFSSAIFDLDADAYILGDMSPLWLKKKGIAPEKISQCTSLSGNETVSPLPGVTVETLSSTDEGVAFLVSADGLTVFHAGDLNWWHWEGEPDPWNPDMAKAFQSYAEPLRGRSIDLAMLPLDPRLKEDGFRGPKHFLELAQIRYFLPMHQWGNFGFTEQFLSCYPEFTKQTYPVTRKGEVFEF
jgi:L-ascorbate metabolism protein UlaG (beta-lactamase superfamily)